MRRLLNWGIAKLRLLRPSTRSLKTTLAFYFIPISIVPTFSISYYAFKLFEESTKENVIRRAKSERDVMVAEIESLENEMVASARNHAKNPRLISALRTRDRAEVQTVVDSLSLSSRTNRFVAIRVFSPSGQFIASRKQAEVSNRINVISREGLTKVKTAGETIERFFSSPEDGWVTLTRSIVRTSTALLGVIEEEIHFGKAVLFDLKERGQTDLVLVSRDFKNFTASLALNSEQMGSFAAKSLRTQLAGIKEPVYLSIGDTRYAAFLYDLPSGKIKNWGYVGVLLPMTAIEATLTKLRLAILYLTILLVATALLAIMVVSNRLVKPIVYLVAAMKRVKTGRVEEISPVESTYEIEYLVRSFNEMTRNVANAKRTLEQKLEELRRANQEIKTTQTTLVQSAKMISLGQIVAGVAHELNNPIGFIHSNMHHLSEYVHKLKELVRSYRELKNKLPPEEQKKAAEVEKALDIDFILNDIEELTQSCVDGANRTKEIVVGLRTFSRMDEANFRYHDIYEGIKSTLRLLTSELKDIEVEKRFGEIPQVECSLSQLNQVFVNLLSNAAHAIHSQGGKGKITIRTSADNGFVEIGIADSGHGMDAETLEKIFDPFFTTKKVGEGTGLGLSITYGLVQKHHGTIHATSQIGKGTEFVIRLPVHQPKAAEAG